MIYTTSTTTELRHQGVPRKYWDAPEIVFVARDSVLERVKKAIGKDKFEVKLIPRKAAQTTFI